ncbi:MAG: hypothetical protein VX589_11415 [Myxococcota bacterium]|nr:hypothetical protein [Myxococcota bacterium]
MVDVIHDGNMIPPEIIAKVDLDVPGRREALETAFFRERDWGAESVARALAAALHLPGYHRVNLARCLLDFGRFPGITPSQATHLGRFAINTPFSQWLDRTQKRMLLNEYYDAISLSMDVALASKLLKIAIHTYDKRNPTAFERPAVSILTRPHGHQRLQSRPLPNFDPSFPSRIVEYTADRLLRARLALTLEEAGLHTANNFPYSLPEGSVEVRAQVLYFYQFLRDQFEHHFADDAPSGLQAEARNLVWTMLLDTNLRSSSSEALRSYLHHFRTPPRGSKRLFQQAGHEYERIVSFLDTQRDDLIEHYQQSLLCPSTIIIEIRKDLVWQFDGESPVGPKPANARRIARLIALAIQQYLVNDRETKKASIARGMSQNDL